ncbi:DUF3499 domain-containing protein [Luteococcus peritonei]|uniref:DUF3499 domain-containing protein n=1 Tax=Luteococcus peritonei TaxID=88874 RepID=A0ABW4RYQ5_9ACTN
MTSRRCTKTGCNAPAVATLTYVYADSTAVLGPLAPEHVPGSYDLCHVHCEAMGVPRGWEVIRLPDITDVPPAASGDDLMALADAVRAVGLRHDEVLPASVPQPEGAEVVVLAERRHLRMIADADPQAR